MDTTSSIATGIIIMLSVIVFFVLGMVVEQSITIQSCNTIGHVILEAKPYKCVPISVDQSTAN